MVGGIEAQTKKNGFYCGLFIQSTEKDIDSMHLPSKQLLEQFTYYLLIFTAALLPSYVIFGLVRLPCIFTFFELWTGFNAALVFVLPYLYNSILTMLCISVGLVTSILTVRLVKGEKERIERMLLVGLGLSVIVSFSFIFSYSLVFRPQVAYAGEKIDAFVATNADVSFESYITNLTSFLNKNVRQAYNKSQASLQINREIYREIFLDQYIMQIWGVTKADVIVFQGWGSCEEAAILIEELLHLAGYETRLAFFIDINHEWAEVKHDSKWLIVDPWWLTSNGTLVEAIDLRNLLLGFQNSSGVRVQYYNGTEANASQEHGY